MRLLAAVFCLSATLAAQTPSFRVDASYVKVPVTALDASGRLMTGLQRSDFTLLDQGQKKEIENFFVDYAPIHVLLLLDTSGSLREELDEIRHSALRFAGVFSREDRISIISFSDRVVELLHWTNRLKAVRKALKKLKRGYRTALYDALAQTVRHRFQGIAGRRVIILLTDGLDNESRSRYRDLIPLLIDSDITLYIVSRTRLVASRVRDSNRVEFLNQVMKHLIQDQGDFVEIYFREKETAMTRLAESTGGRVLFPTHLSELQDSYVEVARELKSRYLLAFRAPAVSSVHFRRIQVLCSCPVGRLHYRKQYAWLPPR